MTDPVVRVVHRITHSPFAHDIRHGLSALVTVLATLVILFAGVELGLALDDLAVVIDQQGRPTVVEVP